MKFRLSRGLFKKLVILTAIAAPVGLCTYQAIKLAEAEQLHKDNERDINTLYNESDKLTAALAETKKSWEIDKAIIATIDKDRTAQAERIKELENTDAGKALKENKELKDKIIAQDKSGKCINPQYDSHPQNEGYGEYCEHADGTRTLRYSDVTNSEGNSKIKNRILAKK